MLKLEVLSLRLDRLLIRFYLMMAVVLIGGYSGIWAIAFLGLPIFLSALLGIRFYEKERRANTENRTRPLGKNRAKHLGRA